MNRSKRTTIAYVIAGSCVLAWLSLGPRPPGASAQATFPDPNANCPPSECGQVSPFIPMQSVEAVHMGLVWKKGSQNPKILYHSRFPQYMVNDMADPELVDLAIERGALTFPGQPVQCLLEGRHTRLRYARRAVPRTPANRLHGGRPPPQLRAGRLVPEAHLRRLPDAAGPEPERADAHRGQSHDGTAAAVRHQPSGRVPEQRQVPHGAARREGLRAEPCRLPGERLLEGDVLQHLLQRARDAVRRTRLRLRRPRHAEQQRVVQGQHLRPEHRNLGQAVGAVRPGPIGARIRSARSCSPGNPNAQFYENCDPRNQQSTQPSDPSDQEYARWYPSAATLPNDLVLVLGGFDQDGTVAPDPDRAAKGRVNQTQSDTAFTASRVNIVVPEVYDPKTDRNISLENARMAFPLYPQMEVVQTGPGKDDWKVCTFNGEINYGTIESEDAPGRPAYRNAQGQRQKGGARFGVGGGTPPLHRREHLVPGRAGGAEGSQPGRPSEEPLDVGRQGARGQALLLPDAPA